MEPPPRPCALGPSQAAHPALGQSATSRLPLSVSTRSMARLASSSLSRPTLSSSRKASSTLKRSTGGLATSRAGAGLGKRAILGETSLNPSGGTARSRQQVGTGMIEGEQTGAHKIGEKRKSREEGGPTKKVRLHSPISRPPTSGKVSFAHRASTKYPTTPLRANAFPITSRSTKATATTPKSSKAWVHPLAHTPNRVHDSPDEGNSLSSDELMLGDSPVPRVGTGDTPMKTVEEYQRLMLGAKAVKSESTGARAYNAPGGGGVAKQDIEVREPFALNGKGGIKEEDHVEMTLVAPTSYQTQSNENEHQSPMRQPIFSFSTSPKHSPPQASPMQPVVRLPIDTAPHPPAPPSPLRRALAPPRTPFSIAPSPRKGLAIISRFGSARKPAQSSTGSSVQTKLPFLPVPSTSRGSEPEPIASSGVDASTATATIAGTAPTPTYPSSVQEQEDIAMDTGDAGTRSTSATNITTKQDISTSMLPPSRIPVRVKPNATIAATSVASHGLKRSALGDLGVAARRPTTQVPGSLGGAGAASEQDNAVPVRRKPSYPSASGSSSGPIARPRDRQISVPVPSHVIEPIHRDVPLGHGLPSTGTRAPATSGTGRSVSAPGPRDHLKISADSEKQALSLSTRREGWMDTSRSLHGLSEALERLKVKKEVPVEPTKRPSLSALSARTSLAAALGSNDEKENTLLMTNHSARETLGMSSSASSRLSAVHRSRQSVAHGLGHGSLTAAGVSGVTVQHGLDGGDVSMAADACDKSLAAIVCSSAGNGCLKGVVAFVDVWTADGSDSSGIFADMLRSLGARVLSRPSDSCTHIVYKSGRPSTLSWYRKQEDPRPHIVGLSWVTRSKEAGKRLEEGKYRVDIGDEDVFAKRRKSMEPKSLCLSALSSSVGPGRESSSLRAGLAEVKRKSLIYAPKVGSPLKKGYRGVSDDEEM